MPTYQCVKGHESSEPDFCSVCGAKVQAGDATASSPQNCPDCNTPRDAGGGIFCEICGYNFNTGAHGELKPSEFPVQASAVIPNGSSWEAIVMVDPSLKGPDSPEVPSDFQPVSIQLTKESNLIGRKSEKRGVFPEVALDRDDAVSHRHALLTKTADGGFVLRDVGSSNGTVLNGTELTPLTDAPVKDGDEFTLGHWTRIRMRAGS